MKKFDLEAAKAGAPVCTREREEKYLAAIDGTFKEPKMTEKVIYRSEFNPIDITPKTVQFFEIEQVFGKAKGLREFKFRNMYQVSNGTTFENIHNINVCHLKSLLEVLKKMDADGFLDDENVKED